MATIKSRVARHALGIFWSTKRAKRLAKKISQDTEGTRYPEMWVNKYVNKKVKKLLKITKVELEVKGVDNLPKTTCILAPNHSSSMDPALMIRALANRDKEDNKPNKMVVFLGKEEIKKNKKVAGFADMLKTFYINRANPRQSLKALDDIAAHAKEHRKHIVIFPEGTRSVDGKIQDFKPGAFKIAQRAFLPIVPVTINNALSITDFANRTGTIKVQVIFHNEIKPMKFVSQKTTDIAANIQKIVKKSWKKPEGKRAEAENKV